jgi:hypothetical protein
MLSVALAFPDDDPFPANPSATHQATVVVSNGETCFGSCGCRAVGAGRTESGWALAAFAALLACANRSGRTSR